METVGLHQTDGRLGYLLAREKQEVAGKIDVLFYRNIYASVPGSPVIIGYHHVLPSVSSLFYFPNHLNPVVFLLLAICSQGTFGPIVPLPPIVHSHLSSQPVVLLVDINLSPVFPNP